MVVMTTRTVERGRIKCGQYWPPEDEAEDEYGHFVVINQGSERFDTYTVTSLLLKNTLVRVRFMYMSVCSHVRRSFSVPVWLVVTNKLN